MLSVNENRQNQIHSKGFNIMRGSSQYLLENGEVDFSKIKVGAKSLDDALAVMKDLDALLEEYNS